MMLILWPYCLGPQQLILLSFFPHPYPECFRGTSVFSSPSKTHCVSLSWTELSMTLSFSLPLTETLRFPVGPISESCYWEEFQEGPIYIEMRMIAAPFHPHRSTDICSLKESFINLRQSLSGGKASHGTRSGLPR